MLGSQKKKMDKFFSRKNLIRMDVKSDAKAGAEDGGRAWEQCMWC